VQLITICDKETENTLYSDFIIKDVFNTLTVSDENTRHKMALPGR